VLELRTDDAASTLMIDRCRQQLDNPSGEDWDGTTIARTK
jgi:adenylate cyclase